MSMQTPKEIVAALDKYIVGQYDAKRAVAIALRNRYRRSQLSDELREEITPKNIIMMGPTGVGKTEIARRLAKLVNAPFVKVEATKFTEVGYVGRDVDSIIRDLMEASIRLTKNRKYQLVKFVAEAAVEQRLVDLLSPRKKTASKPMTPIMQLLGAGAAQQPEESNVTDAERAAAESTRTQLLSELRAGMHEQDIVEIEVEQTPPQNDAMFAIGVDLGDMLGGILPKRTKLRKVPVSEARRILILEESDKLVDMDEVIREAVENAEQNGIVFIDEIDKIIGSHDISGPDVSREGVQRDILPIVEGSTVSTKYGPVKTDHMLFIAAGAFHVAKASDMIPELQGRFPIKVELSSLSVDDYARILTQPENSVTMQYAALLLADSIKLTFTEDALMCIAQHAYDTNETTENIGARRLHTIVEQLLEDISFNAGGDHPLIDVVIDANYVKERLAMTDQAADLSKYII
ncbi:MAG: ATP-dependent protease ATPase subunit HslU [Clostridia bacterium]|nr:ATP-dependent protease ATPase subunit HslU [Clostridia bacterium]